jgi:hypothetical protein
MMDRLVRAQQRSNDETELGEATNVVALHAAGGAGD